MALLAFAVVAAIAIEPVIAMLRALADRFSRLAPAPIVAAGADDR